MPRPIYYNQFHRDFDESVALDDTFREHYTKMADVVIDGQRFGSMPTRMRTGYPGDIYLGKKYGEAMALVSVLALADLHRGANLRSWEVFLRILVPKDSLRSTRRGAASDYAARALGQVSLLIGPT